MRSVILPALLLLGFAGAFGEESLTTPSGAGDVRLRASRIARTDNMLSLSGDVMVSIGSITVYADEAQYDVTTGDLMPQGHVRIHTEKLRNPGSFRLDPGDTPLRMPEAPWQGK